jgi:hypothetical protein
MDESVFDGFIVDLLCAAFVDLVVVPSFVDDSIVFWQHFSILEGKDDAFHC